MVVDVALLEVGSDLYSSTIVSYARQRWRQLASLINLYGLLARSLGRSRVVCMCLPRALRINIDK